MFGRLVVAAVTVALSVRPAHGFLVRQYPPNVYVDPTTTDPRTGKPAVKTQAFVDVTCASTDWGSSGALHEFDVASAEETGVTYKISVKCGMPTYVYDLTTYGFAPQDAQLFKSSACRTTDNSPLNETYAQVIARAALPAQAKRRYAHSQSTAKYVEFSELQSHATRAPLTRPRRRKERAPLHARHGSPELQGLKNWWKANGAGVKSGFGSLARGGAVVGLNVAVGIFGCQIQSGLSDIFGSGIGSVVSAGIGVNVQACNAGVNTETQKRLAELQSKIAESDAYLIGNSTLLWAQVNSLFGNQSQYMQQNNDQWLDQNATNFAVQRQLEIQKAKIDTLNGTLGEVTQQLTKQQAQLNGYIGETNVNLARVNWAVGNLSLATSNSVMWAFGNISALANSSNTATNTLSTQLSNLQATSQRQMFVVNTMIETLMGNVMRGLLRVQDRRMHTKKIRSYIDYVQGAPCVNSPATPRCNYSVYLSDLGVAPKITNGDGFYLEVENVFIRYIARVGSTNRAWEESFQFVCGANFMIDGMMTWQSNYDVLNGIGPNGCDPSAIDSGYCNCYVLQTTQYCTADSRIVASSGPYSYLNATSTWNTYAFLAVSAQNPFPGRPDFCSSSFPTVTTRTITNSSTLSDAMTTLLNQPLYGDSGYVMTTRRGQTIVVLEPIPDLTRWSVLSFMSDAFPRSVPSATMSFVIAAQTILLALSGDFARLVDGTLPGNTSFYDYPMAVTPGGMTAQCSQAAFVAYSTHMLPVQRMLLTGVIYPDTSITSQRCLSSVCDAPVEVNTLGLNYNNPLQAQLPNDHMMVGSPFGDANGYVYDIEQRSISISPDASARAHTATYVICPSDELCSPAYWADFAGGAPFDAFSAVNSPAQYKRVVVRDPITGAYRCNGTDPSVAPTSTCDLREEFDFLPGAADNQTLWLRPRLSGSYVLTFPVVMGSITQYIISACPTPSVVFSNANGVLLAFTNANAYDATISLSIDMVVTATDGSCPPSIPDITVVAGGAAQVWIPACTTDPYALMFLSATDASGNACEGINNFNLTIPPRQHTVFVQGVPDRPYVHQSGQIVADQVVVGLYEGMGRLARAIELLATEQVKTNRLVGVLDPTSGSPADLTPFMLVMNQTRDTGKSIANLTAAVAAARYDSPEEIIARNAAHMAALDAQYADARSTAMTAIQGVSALSTLQNLTLQNIESIRASIVVTSAVYNDVLNTTLFLQRELDGTIISGLKQISQRQDFCSGALGGLCSFGELVWNDLKDVPDFAKEVGKAAAAAAEKGYEDLKNAIPDGPGWPDIGNPFRGLTEALVTMAWIAAIGILLFCFVGCCYQGFKLGCCDGCCSGLREHSEHELMTQEGRYTPDTSD